MIKPEDLTQTEREIAIRTLTSVRERITSYVDTMECPVDDDGTYAIREDAIGKFGNSVIQDLRRWELMLTNHKGE